VERSVRVDQHVNFADLLLQILTCSSSVPDYLPNKSHQVLQIVCVKSRQNSPLSASRRCHGFGGQPILSVEGPQRDVSFCG